MGVTVLGQVGLNRVTNKKTQPPNHIIMTTGERLSKNKFNPDKIEQYKNAIEQGYYFTESEIYILMGEIAECAMLAMGVMDKQK